jgi:hypothetical protein
MALCALLTDVAYQPESITYCANSRSNWLQETRLHTNTSTSYEMTIMDAMGRTLSGPVVHILSPRRS